MVTHALSVARQGKRKKRKTNNTQCWHNSAQNGRKFRCAPFAPFSLALCHEISLMLEQIQSELTEGFERGLFGAAQRNLADKSNPLRFNNYAYAMRELTRHILHRFAPDENVKQCVWYKNETEKEGGITRKQRAYYAVQGGLDSSYVKDVLGLEVDEIHRELVRVINGLSKFTHIDPDVYDLPENEVDDLVNEVTEAVFNFIITINDCRKLVVDGLWEHIDSAVINETLRETIVAIDELASHSYIDAVYTDSVRIVGIDHESIKFVAEGSVDCELQWGSNSDLRRGDGAVLSESFPYRCELYSPIHEPQAIEIEDGSFGVDTRSWTDVRYGQDEIA